MTLTTGARNLREAIEKAIADHKVTKAEYDHILYLATEDSNIDRQEQALLRELQEMIEDKSIKLVP